MEVGASGIHEDYRAFVAVFPSQALREHEGAGVGGKPVVHSLHVSFVFPLRTSAHSAALSVPPVRFDLARLLMARPVGGLARGPAVRLLTYPEVGAALTTTLVQHFISIN